jgi:hypothetical protein
MKNIVLKVFINVFSRLAIASGMLAGTPVAATADDLAVEYQVLAERPDSTAQEWYDLATRARAEADLQVAGKALEKAEEAGLSPVRFGMEKSRQLIVAGQKDSAVTELRGLFQQGFTGVAILQNDDVINSLSGQPVYDELIADMSVQAYPCEYQEGFDDFDFWVGEWDVRLANGTVAGSNVIEKQENDCVMVERWTSAFGGTGMSINYLDKITDEWVQIWNASGGSQINIRGGLTEDGMALSGTIHNVANGTTAPFRGLWTPLEDGRVRQYFEQSNDGGETWVPWFEGFYTRRQENTL